MIRQSQFMNIVCDVRQGRSQQPTAETKTLSTQFFSYSDRRRQPLGRDISDFLSDLITRRHYSPTPSTQQEEIKVKKSRRDANHTGKTKPGKVKKC
jgi:hypothetical protein